MFVAIGGAGGGRGACPQKKKKHGRIALTNREETSLLPLFPTIIKIKTNATYTTITIPRQERNYGNSFVARGSIVLSKTGRKYESIHNLIVMK